jgi:type II secretory pathway component GspD/PulD (secretin)
VIIWPLAAAAQGVEAPSADAPGRNLVSIEATDAALSELIRMLGKAADVKIVLADDIERTVTVNLPEVDVEIALQAIVEAAGCYWQKKGDIYVVTKDPPTLQTGTIAPPPAGPPVGTGGEGGPRPVAVVPPGEDTGPPAVAPPAGTPPPPAEVPAPPTRLFAEIPLQYANCADISLAFGGTVTGASPNAIAPHRPRRHALGGQSWHMGSRSPNGGDSYFGALDMAGTRGAAFRDAFGQLGGGFGGGLGGGGRGGGLGGGGLGGGGGSLTALLPDGIEALTAFLDENALLVSGTPEAIDQFREVVAMLDKPVKQVEISVKFVSITTTFEEAFGIDWAIKNTKLEIFNQGFAPPQAINSVVRFATGNLDAQLNALEKSSRATVINEPRVAVQNNAFASVEFSTEIPYFAAQVTYNEFGRREVDFTADFVPVENYLDVMPRVNADDSVSLYLTPQISNVAGYVEGPNGERIPITVYQTVFTMLRMQDGETVVIGGLITKDDSTTKLHTPLLSKLPIIGKLFDSRAKNLNDTELLIFVTPRILHDAPTD